MKNYSIRFKLYTIFTILCGISLFGSLLWSAFSDNAIYFIFGYPVAFVCILVAGILRK